MKGYLILMACMVSSCAGTRHAAGNNPQLAANGRLWATMWQQRAAEYTALCFQAYQTARYRIDQLASQPGAKPRAVITDIDETVLDNSPYNARQALLGKEYDSKTWIEWTTRAACDTVPGSRSFFAYAASKGIRVFYITNRVEAERAATLKNLQQFGFPDADNEHLLLKTNGSGKEDRRKSVQQAYDVVLYLGDNLSDFTDLFDRNTVADRLQHTIQSSAKFGQSFIVLPNPMYGDWETALFQSTVPLSPQQKDSVIQQAVKRY